RGSEVPRILLLTTHSPPMTTRHLTITDIASTGAGIAYEDGLRVFVPGRSPATRSPRRSIRPHAARDRASPST
ncbi:MAG: hypothetical protein ACLUNV_00160, partial [Sutterella wadsworthensis]